MLDTITMIFMIATFVSAVTCVVSVFEEEPILPSKLVLSDGGIGRSSLEAKLRKKNKRVILSLAAALSFLIVTIAVAKPALTSDPGNTSTESITFPPVAGAAASTPSPTEAVVSATPTSPATPQPAIPTQGPNSKIPSDAKTVLLDELTPIESKPNNFFVDGWSDKKSFHIDENQYSKGLGMQISENETKDEARVLSRDHSYRSDCRETYIEYALRLNYEMISFKLGADRGDTSRYGNESKNGIAEVILSDATTGEVLFDTLWVNCKYSTADVTLDISNVDVLRITYRSSGVVEKKRITKGLRFALVNPILVLSDSGKN